MKNPTIKELLEKALREIEILKAEVAGLRADVARLTPVSPYLPPAPPTQWQPRPISPPPNIICTIDSV